MRVLIVEDEKDMAVVLKEGLEEEDYFVSLAFDGLTGLEVARSCEFDVIILDVDAMVGYVGSRGIHQPFRAEDVDMVLPTPTSQGIFGRHPQVAERG